MIRIQDPDPLVRGMDPRIWIQIHTNVMDPEQWNTVGTSTFQVTTQVAAKLSILSFISEKALRFPVTWISPPSWQLRFFTSAEKGNLCLRLGCAHPAGSQAFFFVFIEKGPGAHGLQSVHPAGS